MTPPRTATASLIASATAPKARRRRVEARVKLETTAVGYLRVSTQEQALSGLGLEAQRSEVERYAEAHGLTVVEWFVDQGVSASTMGKRPQFLAALGAVDAGRAGVLLAKDASRLSRSMSDLAQLLKAATSDGWCIRTADGLVNTCDPQGQLLPHFLGVVADLERQFTSQRTRQALAAAKERGTKLGKRSQLPADVAARIVERRDGGWTWQAVADELNAAGVATGQGGSTWRPSSVRAAYLAASSADRA
jgi:DNA invertase Pin-like site-specific DNA recombinase